MLDRKRGLRLVGGQGPKVLRFDSWALRFDVLQGKLRRESWRALPLPRDDPKRDAPQGDGS
jgi:hypothetical protein